MPIQQLTFQCGEEALAEDIFVAVSGRARRGPDARSPATLSEGDHYDYVPRAECWITPAR